MVKKDDIIKDFQDAVQGVTRNGDECIVLYLDRSTTELRHFGTSHGQHFLRRHEEFIHQFMAFCSGTEKLEGCLNVTDAALSGPNTGNVQIVSGKEVNPGNEPCPSVTDKGQSPGQNTLNSSQEKSYLNQSGTNLIFTGHYRRTGAIQAVTSGKQTGFSPEGKQPDPIVIKDDPDPVLNDLDSVLNDSDPVLNESDSLLNNPDSVLNDPDSALNDPDSVLNDPDSALNDQDSVLNVPDPVQNDQDPMLNYPNPGINDPDLVQIDLDLTQNQSMVIKSDPDSVKSEIHSIKNDQDSVESNLPVAPKKVEQNDIQNASNPVNISGDSVQNEPIPVQRDPDPVQNKPDPLLWDQISLPNRKNPAKKKMFVVLRHKSKPFSTVIPVLNPNSALLNPMLNPRTVPNLKPNSVTVPNRSQNLVTVLNLTPNVVTLPNLKPKPVVVPNLKPNSATEPNLTTNSATVSNITPKPATVPNLTPNSVVVPNLTPYSVVVPNLTPYSATVPNLTPNLATVPNLKTNSVVVPDLATNSAAVPNLTPHSESVSNRTPYLVTLLNRTPNSATVPNLTPTSATVPNLTSYSETVPNLTSYSETVPNLTYNLATVPNLTSNLATAPNLPSNLANDLAIKGKPVDQKQGHVEKLREHTSKADMVQCEEHLDQSQEHMSKAGEHIRPLYSEEVKFLPSTVDIDLECTEVMVSCEDDMEQCEHNLDQSQEHMQHLDQGQEHMELSREQGQEHMELSREQGQEHMELSREQGQEHMELSREQGQEHMELSREQGQEHMELSREQGQEHKYGEHSGFDSYVDSIWMKPKPNPYHVDHPYAKKSEKQMKIPRKQLDVTKKSGEHIGTTGERIKTEDCDMSLLMEVNEIDETRDHKDNKTEKDQTQKIPSGAEKTSSSLQKREVHKPRKQVAENKGLVKEKRFSLMKTSYEANYDMPDGATLTCLQCNQNFKDLKDLQFHLLKTKHEQVSTTETAFKCFTCLRYFQREWDLQQHMINTRHNGNVKKAPKSLYNTKNRVEKVIWTDGSKTYRCFKCNNTYKDFFSAKSHVMRDQCLSKYSIPCQVCDKFFTDKNSHQVHVRTAHKEEFPFRCKNCDKIFYRKNRYARHKEHCIQGIEEIGRSRKAVETCDSENLDAEQICIICRETFINYDQLKAHIVQSGHEQVSTTETINKCFTCNTYFQKYVDLTYHMSLTSHTGNPRVSRKRWVMKSHGAFSCSFCREIFPSVEKCEEHVKEKTCMERWSKKCLFCPKTYFQKNIYEVHIKSEHDYQRPLKCFKCGQEYKQLSSFLKHHEECNHGNDKLPTPQKEGEIKRENYCAICDRTFNSSIVLKLHKWRAHKEAMFKCEICKCKFKRLNQLLFHLKMNKHSSSVSMVRKKKTAANKKSPSSSSMAKTNVKDTTELLSECNVLQKKSKDGQTLYTCGICSRSFGKLDNLTRHQRTNHFRPKSLLCEYCGYETMWISNFRLHVKSVHNMDYDTSLCNICGEEMSKSLLKKHMATHVETQTTQTHVKTQGAAGTRVKTAQLSGKDRRAGKSKEPNVFKCNLCINATFDKNYKYEMHMLRHYGEEGKLPCVMCDSKVAGYTEGMLKHLRRVHHLSYDEAFAIRGNVEPLTLRLGKLMEKYSEKGPPVPDLDYFPSK